tara:strand:- start:19021 stop:20280 length:1260 start_codon:yes stop_codon:yes gene_type:complete
MNGHKEISIDEVKKIFKFAQNAKPLGAGSFKKAYKYNDETVVTLEKFKENSSKKEQYMKLMDAFYKLPEKHLKNILLPYASFDTPTTRVQKLSLCVDNGMVDLWELVIGNFPPSNLPKLELLKNCGDILETIFELHKRYITCMDIKTENTFVNCSGKNYLTLGDADGFRVYDNAYDMHLNSKCIATPGFLIMGSKYNYGKGTLGGPATDYYAWLKVFLVVYMRLFMKEKQTNDFQIFYQPEGIFEAHAQAVAMNLNGYIRLFNDNTRKMMKKLESKSLLELILKAIDACAKDELLKTVNATGWDKGEPIFYDEYIKPIVEMARKMDNKILNRELGRVEKMEKNIKKTVSNVASGLKKLFKKKSITKMEDHRKHLERQNAQREIKVNGGRRTKKRRRRKRTKKRRKKRKRKTKRRRKRRR